MVEAEVVDYSKMSTAQILVEMDKAFKAKDMKLVGQLSRLHVKAEDAAEKVAKEALNAELAKVTASILAEFTKVADKLRDSGKLDGADGIWFAWDFGEAQPTLKLTKAAARKITGTGGGKSSYVASPYKSEVLLGQVGDHIMFPEATSVTIDKVEHTIPAGTTLKAAFNYSKNGGWRNRVVMALRREAGVI